MAPATVSRRLIGPGKALRPRVKGPAFRSLPVKDAGRASAIRFLTAKLPVSAMTSEKEKVQVWVIRFQMARFPALAMPS